MSKPDGYMVVEGSDDFYGPLALRAGGKYPDKGILDWPDGKEPVAIFATAKEARRAITRTRHYAKAFDRQTESGCCLPTAYECRVVPVARTSLGGGHRD